MNTLFENPPDFLACAGAYNKPGRGGACVGVLMNALDADLNDWAYTVYSALGCPNSSLKERIGAIARLLIIPTESDKGLLRLKAEYKRVRSLDHPEELPGLSTLVVNESQAMNTMLSAEVKRIAKDKFAKVPTGKKDEPDIEIPIDLSGFIYQPVDIKSESKQVIEWMDGLLSAIADGRVRFLGNDNFGAKVLESLRSLVITNSGQVKEDDPLLMAMLFSVGRAEYLAQTRQIPLQMLVDSKKREAIARGV